MNVVVDTSIWIDFFAGKPLPDVEEALKSCLAHVTPLVVAEIVSGNLSLGKERQLLEFLGDLPLIDCPYRHWINVGKLRRKCRERGLSVSTPDAHIAQATLDIGGILLSRDKIFTKISGICGLKTR